MRNPLAAWACCALLVFLAASRAGAQPAPWAEALLVVVSERSGADLVQHQVLLSFDTASLIAEGRLRPDAADLRFAADLDGNVPIPHWIESGVGSADTRVWLRLPSLPASGHAGLYLFIGNPEAASTSTLSVFDYESEIANSATQQTSNFNLGGVPDSQRGFRFSVNEDILVVSLGKFTPSSNPRTVTLFDAASQAVLEQTSVSGDAATWSYAALPTPRWLLAGREYLLQIYTPASDATYYFGALPVTTPRITYLDMRYCNACTPNTYPTNALGNILYGYVDFQFRSRKQASPQPSAAIGPGASTTALAANANPADFATAVVLTASVDAPYAPTGEVAFSIDGAVVCNAPLVDGSAECVVEGLAVGSFPATAAYLGDLLNSGSSDELLLQVQPVLPGAPTGVSGVGGNGLAIIDFDPPAFDGGLIAQFTAQCSADGIDIRQSGAGSPIAVGGLTNGTTYACGVFASNPAGDGPLSSLVPVTPLTVPSAPRSLLATASDRHVLLSFEAPIDDGGAPVLGYLAACSDGIGSVDVAGTASPLVVAGLSNGTVYACRVAAQNAAGVGAETPEALVVPREIVLILPTALPTALLDQAYQVQLLAGGNGTSGSFDFDAIGGELPPGLSLSSDGLISGSPSQVGDYSVTIRASDQSPPPLGPFTATRTYQLRVLDTFVFLDGFEPLP